MTIEDRFRDRSGASGVDEYGIIYSGSQKAALDALPSEDRDIQLAWKLKEILIWHASQGPCPNECKICAIFICPNSDSTHLNAFGCCSCGEVTQ